MHMGRHMEEIAFSAMPQLREQWDFYSESTDSVSDSYDLDIDDYLNQALDLSSNGHKELPPDPAWRSMVYYECNGTGSRLEGQPCGAQYDDEDELCSHQLHNHTFNLFTESKVRCKLCQLSWHFIRLQPPLQRRIARHFRLEHDESLASKSPIWSDRLRSHQTRPRGAAEPENVDR